MSDLRRWMDVKVRGVRMRTDVTAHIRQLPDLTKMPLPPDSYSWTGVSGSEFTGDITPHIVKALATYVSDKDTFIWSSSLGLTDIKLLTELFYLASGCHLIQKDSRTLWTNKQVARWAPLYCDIRRSDFDSNILPHLSRVDNRVDYGLIEPVKVIGTDAKNAFGYLGEYFGFFHKKVIGVSTVDAGGKFKARLVIKGSKNGTENSNYSEEEMSFVRDEGVADYYFRCWEHSYVFSEGLGEVGKPLRPMYNFNRKKISAARPPQCPDCSSAVSVSPFYVSRDNVLLRCTTCNTIYTFPGFGDL